MPGRPLEATLRALKELARFPKRSIYALAAKHGLSPSTIYYALRNAAKRRNGK